MNLAAVTFFLLRFSRHGVGFGFYHMDLDVYRIGSQVWLRGGTDVHVTQVYGPGRRATVSAVLMPRLCRTRIMDRA